MGILPTDPADYTTADIGTLITNITRLALLLAGGIAIVYIIIGAISYLTAYGNEEKATQGKKTVTWALVGLAVVILSEMLINEVMRFIS